MIFIIAWKNIWRNVTRSSVVLASIALGIMGGLFICAISVGIIKQRIDAAIRNEISNIQIHHPHYLLEKDMADTIPGASVMIEKIKSLPGVKEVSGRICITGMAATANKASGIMIVGIDPDKERKVTSIYQNIADSMGTYFSNDKKNTILIGKKLADELKVKLKSKIVLTFQTEKGDMIQAAFRVGGIYKTNNSAFDGRNVFVRHHELSTMIGYENFKAHEIAISILDDTQNSTVVNNIKNTTSPDMTVQSWKEVMPELGMMADMTSMSLYVIMIIFMLALCFGIINTMLMAILERTRELGMLMAVGMSRMRVFYMITLETVLLSLSGAAIGMGTGIMIIEYYQKNGFDLSQFASGMEQMGFDAMIYPYLEPNFYIGITLLVIVTGILSSIIPARRALKLKPVEAIRQL